MLLDNCFDGGGVNSLGLFFKWIQNEFNLLLDKGGAPEKRWPVGSRRPFLCMVVLDHWVDWKDLGCVWCGLQIYLLASWGRKCLYNRFLLTFSYIFPNYTDPVFRVFFFTVKWNLWLKNYIELSPVKKSCSNHIFICFHKSHRKSIHSWIDVGCYNISGKHALTFYYIY